MKLLKSSLLLLFIIGHCYSQNLDSIQKKFAIKVCNCIGQVNNYEELKPLIGKCYDTTMNYIFNDATPDEVKFYTSPGNLKLVAQRLEYDLKSTCPTVVRVINDYIKPRSKENNYPTNFDQKTFEEAKKDLNSWDGRTISFDAEIVKVNKSNPTKPFLKVKLASGQFIWVGDMTNSDFEIAGNKVRFLGYYHLADKSSKDEYNQFDFVVISFASLELNSSKITFYPGSEKQIFVWANGEVPKSKK
ncbi:MAG: hypothetical protein M3N30_12660 [Bacteroidota bacterium]|nr:hypothetical protein [Bacteroidota bacterium]